MNDQIASNAPTLLQFFKDFVRGPREFTIFDRDYRRRSYQQVADAASAFTQRLIEQGRRPGDRAIISSEHRPEWLAAFWGCVFQRIVVVAFCVGALIVVCGGCAGANKRPPSSIIEAEGTFTPFPPVGTVSPVSIRLTLSHRYGPPAKFSIRHDSIRGITAAGSEVSALSLDEAGERAGGLPKLAAALENTPTTRHVTPPESGLSASTKKGLAIGCLPGYGIAEAGGRTMEGAGPIVGKPVIVPGFLIIGASIPICLAGGAVGAGVGAVAGLVGDTASSAHNAITGRGALNYVALSDEAVFKETAAKDNLNTQFRTLIFFPAGNYKSIKVVVTDLYWGDSRTVELSELR